MTDVPTIVQTSRLKQALRPGYRAIKKLWLPFVVIQLLGLAIVVGYFQSEGMRSFCEKIAAVKERGGIPAAMIAMALGGGLLPEVFRFITGVDTKITRQRVRNTILDMVIFGTLGFLCDALYKMQGVWFGDEPTVKAIVLKMAVDQFIFSPCLSLPFIAIMHTWRDEEFGFGRTARRVNVEWYLGHVVTLLVVCWAYWIPMSLVMYALPIKLVFVFNVIASAASSLVFTSIGRKEHH